MSADKKFEPFIRNDCSYRYCAYKDAGSANDIPCSPEERLSNNEEGMECDYYLCRDLEKALPDSSREDIREYFELIVIQVEGKTGVKKVEVIRRKNKAKRNEYFKGSVAVDEEGNTYLPKIDTDQRLYYQNRKLDEESSTHIKKIFEHLR